ncbi:MAG TPA: cytochrome c maturation protein CcmE [Beijerinckiaceae bacterium]|nr:cytochrome c maturation protein CcmE [Beijerinckiaceae bacterium]
MTRKQRRITLIASAGAILALAVALILTALKDRIVFFRSPTEVQQMAIKPGQRFRLGGLVENASVERAVGQRISFRVTDGNASITVRHVGILPDLFREGQGVVCEGVLHADGSFLADTVLAKHDENYMPREVSDALKKQGHWQGEAKPGEAGGKPK